MVRSCERKTFILNPWQMTNPALIQTIFKIELSNTGLSYIEPINLLHLTQPDQPVFQSGRSGGVNLVEFHTAFRRWIYAN